MNLRVLRKVAHLTQQELADKAGVDNSLISLLESGKRDIYAVQYQTVVRLARALDIEPHELAPLIERGA